jgi:predicted nucleic acid-binding protein
MNPILPKVLVDTSSWIEALRKSGNTSVHNRVMRLFTEGQACVNELILLELWNGAQGDREKSFLKKMQKDVDCLTITSAIWEKSYFISRINRDTGITISSTDILIFATAQHYGVLLEHCDKDFELLEKLKID